MVLQWVFTFGTLVLNKNGTSTTDRISTTIYCQDHGDEEPCQELNLIYGRSLNRGNRWNTATSGMSIEH